MNATTETKPSELASDSASARAARCSTPELLALADTLCEKVGAFGFYYWEGTAKEMFAAAQAYDEARKASNS